MIGLESSKGKNSEITCALVACGANVIILDYEPNRAERIKGRLDCGPGCAKVVYANVLERDTLMQAKEVIQSGFGRVDGLINAAEATIHRQRPAGNDLSSIYLRRWSGM